MAGILYLNQRSELVWVLISRRDGLLQLNTPARKSFISCVLVSYVNNVMLNPKFSDILVAVVLCYCVNSAKELMY